MLVTRLQVEEGFLDGLDITFEPGLNAIIGPRGTGKTSIVELVRFCFGVPAYTKNADVSAREHALSILGSGRATVTVRVDGKDILISRTGTESSARQSQTTDFQPPILLSQNEIEQVGLQATGRLALVDGFRADTARSTGRAAELRSAVASNTVELSQLTSEVRQLEEDIGRLVAFEAELNSALTAQQVFDESLAGLSEERERLSELDRQLAQSDALTEIFERAVNDLKTWVVALERAATYVPDLPRWPALDRADELDPARALVDEAKETLEAAISRARHAIDEVSRLEAANRADVLSRHDESRELRRRLDSVSEGAGSAARRVSELQSQLGRLPILRESLVTKLDRRDDLQTRRAALLDHLDHVHSERIAAREEVLTILNSDFGPRLRFELLPFASNEDYATAIAEALKGTGLHYNTLAPELASALSPRELAEFTERYDVEGLAELSGLNRERAARVLAALSEAGLESVLASEIDDAIELSLLDGSEYKPSTLLSTGQRCTIVLPILLRHRDRVLVIDQPEDHLDNAFIVETVVRAVRDRGLHAQLICTTHNPNIPVLGDAAKVILLGSDGRRGFVRQSGALTDADIVEAITEVMEGGREAFQLRAQFYGLSSS